MIYLQSVIFIHYLTHIINYQSIISIIGNIYFSYDHANEISDQNNIITL